MVVLPSFLHLCPPESEVRYQSWHVPSAKQPLCTRMCVSSLCALHCRKMESQTSCTIMLWTAVFSPDRGNVNSVSGYNLRCPQACSCHTLKADSPAVGKEMQPKSPSGAQQSLEEENGRNFCCYCSHELVWILLIVLDLISNSKQYLQFGIGSNFQLCC